MNRGRRWVWRGKWVGEGDGLGVERWVRGRRRVSGGRWVWVGRWVWGSGVTTWGQRGAVAPERSKRGAQNRGEQKWVLCNLLNKPKAKCSL